MKLPLIVITNEICCHPVNTGPILIKTFRLSSRDTHLSVEHEIFPLVHLGVMIFTYLHQSIVRPYYCSIANLYLSAVSVNLVTQSLYLGPEMPGVKYEFGSLWNLLVTLLRQSVYNQDHLDQSFPIPIKIPLSFSKCVWKTI